MATRIAINGFGRIGRCVVRAIHDRAIGDVELVAINDLTDSATLAHLLKYDSVHRTWSGDVKATDGGLEIAGKQVPVSAITDPAELPWKRHEVDIVLECTGHFTSRDLAAKHLSAGAKRVIVSAPTKEADATFCVGINTERFDPSAHQVISNASCTTNCLAPVAKVLQDSFGIVKGHMVTVHAFTNDQRLLDLPHKDLRRARAATLSMIPASTGAARAIGLVLPELLGKLEGTAVRVPTADVSLVCLTAQVAKATSREEVNAALKEAADGPLAGILGYETAPLVSCDYLGDARSSIVDAAQTQVVGGDLVEVQAWYDNEWGFSNRLIDLALFVASKN